MVKFLSRCKKNGSPTFASVFGRNNKKTIKSRKQQEIQTSFDDDDDDDDDDGEDQKHDDERARIESEIKNVLHALEDLESTTRMVQNDHYHGNNNNSNNNNNNNNKTVSSSSSNDKLNSEKKLLHLMETYPTVARQMKFGKQNTRTLLHLVVQLNCSLSVVRAVYKLDPIALERKNHTILHQACQTASLRIVTFLVQQGPPRLCEIQDSVGKVPLSYAVLRTDDRIAQLVATTPKAVRLFLKTFHGGMIMDDVFALMDKLKCFVYNLFPTYVLELVVTKTAPTSSNTSLQMEMARLSIHRSTERICCTVCLSQEAVELKLASILFSLPTTPHSVRLERYRLPLSLVSSLPLACTQELTLVHCAIQPSVFGKIMACCDNLETLELVQHQFCSSSPRNEQQQQLQEEEEYDDDDAANGLNRIRCRSLLITESPELLHSDGFVKFLKRTTFVRSIQICSSTSGVPTAVLDALSDNIGIEHFDFGFRDTIDSTRE